jgi:hypothetical protein
MEGYFLIIILYYWYIGTYIGTSSNIVMVTKKNNDRSGNLHIAPFIFLKWVNNEIASSFEPIP